MRKRFVRDRPPFSNVQLIGSVSLSFLGTNTIFFGVMHLLSGADSESPVLAVHARGRINESSGTPISTVHSDEHGRDDVC